MKPFNDYRMRFVFIGIVLCSTFALPMLLVGQAHVASNNHQESSEVVIMIAGYEHRYQQRPDLGYVVKTQEKTAGVSPLSSALSFLHAKNARPIRCLDRHGVWVIEDKRPAGENEKIIKTLRANRQIEYVAPLFSSNGGIVAVIPEIVIRVHPGVDSANFLCEVFFLRTAIWS